MAVRSNSTRAIWHQYSLAVILMICPPAGLFADKVVLRSGQVITGSIVGQDRQTIRIQVAGQGQVISKGQVARVQYDGDGHEKPDPAKKENQKPVEQPVEERKPEVKNPAEKPTETKVIPKPIETDDPAGPRTTSLVGAVWRSSVLPGWGQFANGRDVEAAVVAAATVAIVYRATQQRITAAARLRISG